MGADVMQANIPPPPPGFTIVSGGSAPPPPAPVRQPAPRPAASSQPRGLRNNNPGNIEDGAFARSLPGYAGSDGRFARFENADAGAQAAPRLLASYIDRGFNTPAEIINRWAPPSDNNPTAQYASYVAQRAGVGLNDPVTADHIPLIAQAISEFENGQTQGGAVPQAAASVPPPPPGFEIVPGALDDLNIHRPESVDMQAAAALGERAYVGPGSSRDNPLPVTADTPRDVLTNLKKGMWISTPDGVKQLSGDAYINENAGGGAAETRIGQNAVLREENLADQSRAFAMAAAEQIPFLDEAAVGAAGLISGRGYSDVRDSYRALQGIDNQVNRGQRIAGGLTGAATGVLLPGDEFIAGARGAAQVGRAIGVGAGYGALYGAAGAEGGLESRAKAGLLGMITGAGVGGAVQAGTQGLMSAGRNAQAQAAMNPTPQRLLSNAGVDMTIGQILGGVPRTIEDGLAGTVPFVGDAINARKLDTLASYNRAEINGALGPINGALPAATDVGRDGVRAMREQISNEYRRVLGPVQVPRDQPFEAALTTIRAGRNLTPTARRELNGIIDNVLERFQGTIDGETWKQIDSELGAYLSAASNASAQNPIQRVMRDRIGELQTAYRGTLRRADPAAADAIQAADEAFANSTRIVDASQRLGTTARGGIFSGADMNGAVRAGDNSGGNVRFAEGEARMQGLNRAAVEVLPNTVPNSGTPLRGIIAGATGAGLLGGAAINPGMAALAGGGLLGGSVLYSRTVQGWVNAAYRARTPGQVRQALAPLLEAARRDPALLPVYEQALRGALPASQAPLDPAREGTLAPQ